MARTKKTKSANTAPSQAATAKPFAKARGKNTPVPATSGKLSAVAAAAKVLAEKGQPMTCPEMIQAMTARGYWSSPAGKTPAATLYSALLREINTKADAARFCKVDRGKFALHGGK
jgi:hypothetical protein